MRGWFRLGRDYETVGDIGRANDCFERGENRGDCECTYVSCFIVVFDIADRPSA